MEIILNIDIWSLMCGPKMQRVEGAKLRVVTANWKSYRWLQIQASQQRLTMVLAGLVMAYPGIGMLPWGLSPLVWLLIAALLISDMLVFIAFFSRICWLFSFGPVFRFLRPWIAWYMSWCLDAVSRWPSATSGAWRVIPAWILGAVAGLLYQYHDISCLWLRLVYDDPS